MTVVLPLIAAKAARSATTPFNIAPSKKQTFDPLPLRRFHVLYFSNPRWLWATVRVFTALQTRTLSSPDLVNLVPDYVCGGCSLPHAWLDWEALEALL